MRSKGIFTTCNKGHCLMGLVVSLSIVAIIFVFLMNNYMSEAVLSSISKKVYKSSWDLVTTEKAISVDLKSGVGGIEILSDSTFNVNGVNYSIDAEGLLRCNNAGFSKYIYRGNVSMVEEVIEGKPFLKILLDDKYRLFKL